MSSISLCLRLLNVRDSFSSPPPCLLSTLLPLSPSPPSPPLPLFSSPLRPPPSGPLELPTIINWTKFHSFAKGSTALVTCEATGHPPPTITWSRSHRKRSVPIPTQFNLRVHQFKNGTLGFFPAYEADSGTYTCIATNQGGSWHNQTVVFVSGEC